MLQYMLFSPIYINLLNIFAFSNRESHWSIPPSTFTD
jgi:hypothetical protein